MYETLKRLYKGGQLREEQLASAVAKGWLTEAQAKEIKGKERTDGMEKAKAIALTVQSLLTLAGAWLSNKLGALAPVLGMLLAAMAIDYISGLVAAAREGLAGGPGLESGKGVRGILKKLGYLLAIAAAMLFDWLLVNVAGQLGFTLPATAIFGLLVAVWFLLNEILSITENMGRAGVPLPGFLRSAVSALKRTVDKQGDGLAASLEEKEKSHD